jgi:hypothetical protein
MPCTRWASPDVVDEVEVTWDDLGKQGEAIRGKPKNWGYRWVQPIKRVKTMVKLGI